MQFDWSVIWPAIPILLDGAKMTLWISILGLAGGIVIGLLAGLARTYGGWIANHIALVFIEVIRGTPIVVQVMYIYFALPMAFPDIRIDTFTAAVITIMINSGAYIAEITRGSVCKYPSFSSTHFLRIPVFQPSAGTLPASGCSGIREVARCYIPSASVR